MLQQASVIAVKAMQTAYDGVRPGVRQCDLMADVVAAQTGTPELAVTKPHFIHWYWQGGRFNRPSHVDRRTAEKDQTIAFELGDAANVTMLVLPELCGRSARSL